MTKMFGLWLMILAAMCSGSALGDPVQQGAKKTMKFAQCGTYTNCWASTGPNEQIIAPNATSSQACYKALVGCLGHEVTANYSTNAMLQPCNYTVTMCNRSN